MPSGACRALVSSLFSLAVVATALGAAALPAAAATEALKEDAISTYVVRRDGGAIEVKIILNLRNDGSDDGPRTWGPIYIEDGVNEAEIQFQPRGVQRVGELSDLPGPWSSMQIRIPQLGPGDERQVSITYPLEAGDLLNTETPARLGDAYVYFCMTGQPADSGVIIARLPSRYDAVTSGSPMTDEEFGLTTDEVDDPGDLFACVEGTVARNLETDRFVGPSDREVILQAPRGDARWLGPARANAAPALEALHAFIGHDIPGDRPVIIRMTPPAELGGYASDHSTPGVVQLDEAAGTGAGTDRAYHEMAHAWFGADRFSERWMREGLAEWAARSARGETCPDLSTLPADLDLSTWEVERPSAPDGVETVIQQQRDASCAIMGLLAARMGEDRFKEVIASMLDAEQKYIGHAEPGKAVADGVDWMEFLDAVDERGLAAMGDEELDFAQNLLASYGIADDPALLEQRSALRKRYHEFLKTSTPLAAPAIVRDAMDQWQFGAATAALDEADKVLSALTSADALLPEAGLVPFIQPGFEAAQSSEDLAAVRTEAENLLSAAETILPPLNELRQVTPEDWLLPAAIRDAVTEQRFDDALAAVDPAVDIAKAVTEADTALPEAGLRERYKAQFEAAATAEALETLADRVRDVQEEAEATGFELEGLRAAAGDWVIPGAVTAPIVAGQISEALDIVRDARVVVTLSRQADEALPQAALAEKYRPRFEAVTSAEEMAALRDEAEAQLRDAITIGQSYSEVRTTVPTDWKLPKILDLPIEQGDFKTAAATLTAAAKWVRFASQADERLPQMEAMARTREAFEKAVTLKELEEGADLAEDWATASGRVADAIEVSNRDRDMMTTFGMVGTDLGPLRDQAIAAAKEGDVALATQRAQQIVDAINDGSRNGGLRLAGIVFLIVAIIGVLGLWWLFRRNQGPPWARNSRPPWAEKPASSKKLIPPPRRR